MKRLDLRLTDEQHTLIKAQAAYEHRSINAFMVFHAMQACGGQPYVPAEQQESAVSAMNVRIKGEPVEPQETTVSSKTAVARASEPECEAPLQEVQEKVQPEPAARPELIYVEHHEYEGCDCDWNEGGGIKDPWTGKMRPYTGPDCAIKRIQRELLSR